MEKLYSREFEEYRRIKSNIDSAIKELSSRLKGGKIKDVSWGTVADMLYVQAKINEILNHLPEKKRRSK